MNAVIDDIDGDGDAWVLVDGVAGRRVIMRYEFEGLKLLPLLKRGGRVRVEADKESWPQTYHLVEPK
jgi:hypothetical protein